jgi:hypothetical protein
LCFKLSTGTAIPMYQRVSRTFDLNDPYANWPT